MDLSVIIVNRNGGDLLERCVQSVFDFTHAVHFEVIVVDNGSTDGSPERIQTRFPAVRLLRNPSNNGFARAVNLALKTAQGRVISLLNNDALSREGSLDRMVRCLDEHPHAGICGAQLLNEDGSRQNSYDNFPSLATELLNKSLLRRLFPRRFPSKRQVHREPFEVESVIGACLAVRRDVIDQIGPLDEDYFVFVEETDWCWRARKAGLSVVHVPDVEVVHLQGQTKRRAPARSKVEYLRSVMTFLRKRRGSRTVVFFYGGLFVKILATLIFTIPLAILTLFMVSTIRRKLGVTVYVLTWLLLGCPRSFGLEAARV